MALKLICRKSNQILTVLQGPQLTSRRCLSVKNSGKSMYRSADSKKIGFFVLNRYVMYMKNYESYLTKKFPTVMSIYKSFMLGVKDFYNDIKKFVKIVKVINAPGNSIKSLTRQELELYDQMPRDMFKIAPVLITSTLPLANYVIFPLIYMYPKQLLTSHFWTTQQKAKYYSEIIDARLKHKNPIFKIMYTKFIDEPFDCEWQIFLKRAQYGEPLSLDDILTHRRLFTGPPFHMYYLSRSHIRHLLKLHDVHTGWFRRDRLSERALIYRAMDYTILMEGGVNSLPKDALRKACYIRGLDSFGKSDLYLQCWLQKWIALSTKVNKNSLSLLLHAPLLISVNEEDERKLLNASV